MLPGNNKNQADKRMQAFALLQNGQIADARTLLARLCKKNPRDGEIVLALGTAEGMLGNFQVSENILRKAIAILPEQAGAHYSLGKALQAQGKLMQAAKSFSRACTLQPESADFQNCLSNALNELGHFKEALVHINKAAEIEPDNAIFHFNMGNVLGHLGLREQAVSAYHKALSVSPGFINALTSLGNALMSLDELDEAMEVYDQALVVSPDNHDALAGKAAVLNRLGRFPEAGALLDPLLKGDEVDAGVAATYAQIARHIDRESDALCLVERLLENTGLSPARRARLCFASGSLYDRSGQFDKAFPRYAEGNSLRHRKFDMSEHRNIIDNIIETFSTDFLNHSARAHNNSEIPVFIIGMPRSGTTLVEQILASHPKVYGAGELDLLGNIADSIPVRVGKTCDPVDATRDLTAETIDEMANEYLTRLAAYNPAALRITDKMPANFLGLGLVDLLFPSARIIHCIRNPRDTCLSCFFQDFASHHPYANNLTLLGEYYREYERLMAHWRTVLRVPMLEIQYEDLVSSAETVTRKIIDFCGLEWDEACLHFHKAKRTVATSSFDQVRRPLYTSSVGRWRNYEKHISELTNALGIQSDEN